MIIYKIIVRRDLFVTDAESKLMKNVCKLLAHLAIVTILALFYDQTAPQPLKELYIIGICCFIVGSVCQLINCGIGFYRVKVYYSLTQETAAKVCHKLGGKFSFAEAHMHNPDDYGFTVTEDTATIFTENSSVYSLPIRWACPIPEDVLSSTEYALIIGPNDCYIRNHALNAKFTIEE